MGLQEIRKQKGLTQKDIAAFVGISLRAYANYEQGRSKREPFTGKTTAMMRKRSSKRLTRSMITPSLLIFPVLSKTSKPWTLKIPASFESANQSPAYPLISLRKTPASMSLASSAFARRSLPRTEASIFFIEKAVIGQGLQKLQKQLSASLLSAEKKKIMLEFFPWPSTILPRSLEKEE